MTGETKQMASHKSFQFHLIGEDETDIRHYGSVLYRPRADYNTEVITLTTTQDVDQDKYESDFYMITNRERDKGEAHRTNQATTFCSLDGGIA